MRAPKDSNRGQKALAMYVNIVHAQTRKQTAADSLRQADKRRQSDEGKQTRAKRHAQADKRQAATLTTCNRTRAHDGERVPTDCRSAAS